MAVGLRIISWANGQPYRGKRSGGPEWLTWFDLEVNAGSENGGEPTYPTGDGDTSPDPAEALRFATAAEAMECWRGVSESVPVRPDGKPNRPLTVFNVEVLELPDGAEEED